MNINLAALADDNRILTGERDHFMRKCDALAAELAVYKETLSICQDRNARAHAETAAANARVRELEAERDEALRMGAHAHERAAELEADLAHSALSSAPSPRYNRAMARIAVLEAFLAKVLPPGIEDGCDECGGDLAKCHAENPDCYIAEARRLLPASVPETVAYCATCEDGECAAHPHTSDRGTKL